MADFYVAPTGSNDNPGTIDEPFLTVQYGIDALGGGDTLYIRAGTYTEGLHSIPSGTDGSPTIVRAYESEVVTVDGQWSGYQIWLDTVSWIEMNSLMLNGLAVTKDGVELGYNTSNVSMLNCELFNQPSHSIMMKGNGNLVDNCYLYDGGTLDDAEWGGVQLHGIYVKGNNNTISNTEITGQAVCAIHVWDGGDFVADDNVFEGNELHHNGWSTNYPGRPAVGIYTGDRNIVLTNDIHDQVVGCRITYDVVGTWLDTNTFENCDLAIEVGDGEGTEYGPAVDTVLENNVFISCATDIVDNGTNTTIIQEPDPAITRGATVTTYVTSDAVTTVSELHTVDADTTLLILAISQEAQETIVAQPFWNTTEPFVLIHTSGGTTIGNMKNHVYGLVNPTAGEHSITYETSPNDNIHHTAVNYIGTVATSVIDATNYLNEVVNDSATLTTILVAGGSAGETLLVAAAFLGGDGDPATDAAGFTVLANSATGTKSSDIAFYVADLIGGAPAAITVDWQVSDQNVGQLIEIIMGVDDNVDELIASNLASGVPALSSSALSQLHALIGAVVAAQSPTLGTPTIGQVHALIADTVEAQTPIVETPTLALIHNLTASNVDVQIPVLEVPSIGQTHTLVADNVIVQLPLADTPTIEQIHILTANDIVAQGVVVESSSLGQVYALIANGAVVQAPLVDTPTIEQVHALGAGSVETQVPLVDVPILEQIHILSTTSTEAQAPILDSSLLSQLHLLLAEDILLGIPLATDVNIAQIHPLIASSMETPAPLVDTPAIRQVHVLESTNAEVQLPTVASPSLSQLHMLSAEDILSDTPVPAGATIAQVSLLTALGIAAQAPLVDGPIISQTHLLNADSVATQLPIVDLPSTSQIHVLVAGGVVTGLVVAGSSSLESGAEKDSLVANSIVVRLPVLGTPTIAQIYTFSANGIATDVPMPGIPVITQIHALRADGIITNDPMPGRATLNKSTKNTKAMRMYWLLTPGR